MKSKNQKAREARQRPIENWYKIQWLNWQTTRIARKFRFKLPLAIDVQRKHFAYASMKSLSENGSCARDVMNTNKQKKKEKGITVKE